MQQNLNWHKTEKRKEGQDFAFQFYYLLPLKFVLKVKGNKKKEKETDIETYETEVKAEISLRLIFVICQNFLPFWKMVISFIL